jgi:Flp pilus assembly protein TadG
MRLQGYPRRFAAGVRRRIHSARHWRETERGQALVETAMVLPIILLLLFGLIDFGRAFYTWIVLTNSAREGARVGAVQGTSGQITSRINQTASSLESSKMTIKLTNVQGPRGQAVDVALEYRFQYVTPMGAIMSLMGGSALSNPTIKASASMRLE